MIMVVNTVKRLHSDVGQINIGSESISFPFRTPHKKWLQFRPKSNITKNIQRNYEIA